MQHIGKAYNIVGNVCTALLVLRLSWDGSKRDERKGS